MPVVQHANWGSVAPTSLPTSNVPSPRLASANDASTSAWAVSARRRLLPRIDGPIANPIASQRALTSTAAPIAASAVPPPPSTLSAANCAAPEKTPIDITIGATWPITGTARTPNAMPRAKVGGAQREPGADAGPESSRRPQWVSYLLMSSSGKSATHRVEPETAHLWGGRLCLDFANTVDWTDATASRWATDTEVLRTPRELVRWGRRLELVGRCAADEAELAAALALRLALYRAFAAIAEGEPPRPADLEHLRAAHAEAVAAGTPAPRDGGWGYAWPRGAAASIRHAVAADAAALLADPGARPPLPGPRLPLAVPRRQRPPPVVLDVHLRQPRQDAPPVCPTASRLFTRRCVVAT